MELIPSTAAIIDVQTSNRIMSYVENSKSVNTREAYKSDWKHFTQWCEAHAFSSVPASQEYIAAYVINLADEGMKMSTILRRLSSISQAHEAAGFDNPTRSVMVKATIQGLKRQYGMAQNRKTAAVVEDVKMMVEALPNSILGVRDRAILLLGFSGAFRRSELVALDREDILFEKRGMVITMRRSKTDQEGRGFTKGVATGKRIHTCPVQAVEAWIEAAKIESGALFRHVNRHGQVLASRLKPQAIAIVVKRAAESVGLDPARYAGHSLRSGLCTSAASAGVSERDIMRQTNHKSVGMVRRYIQSAELFVNNASSSIGL